MDTPNRLIPYVPEGTLDPAAGLNLALDVIDAVIVPKVISMALTTPPVDPMDGDLYIAAASATDAWAGLDDYLVRYRSEGDFWQSYPPEMVYLVLNADDQGLYKWDDGSPGSWGLASGLGDAPDDGGLYARRNEAWEAVPSASAAPVVTESGADRVALPAHAGDYTRFTNSSAKTYEFDGSESWVVGSEFHGRNHGAGDLTIIGSSGMTINEPAGGSLVIPSGGTFTVKIVAADEADLIGVTEPQS